MSKILRPQGHRRMDYLVVIAYAIAPTLFGFSQRAAITMYILTAYHLGLTLLTWKPMGQAETIPPRVHALMESITPVMLVALPWIVGFAGDPSGRNFFIASAVVVLLTRLMTDYSAAEREHARLASAA